ncbi:hypothetical protein GCM10011583_71360 [Streptomyces camponoticapitis]|uniref:PPM-type phosphatase domain-containing protein n=1 Tax=Streptomyces camponoticapitis TaxID=1616125 RepID=A0ABQ2EZ21_9ACTN|nr:SpoIIE family protein phosphatase [Streptomyces camponoticapitis]GGK29179.1 hypothetical protein GCM10011583_71360 [Streptomyces camponoticapitis]
MGSFDWEPRSGTLQVDDAGLALFALRPEDYDGRLGSLLPRVEDRERLHAAWEEHIKADRTSFSIHFLITWHEGEPRWVHMGGRILRDERVPPGRVVGVLRDTAAELTGAGRGLTSALQRSAEALSTALTVNDVISVLTGRGGLERFGADGLALGLMNGEFLDLVELSGNDMELFHGLVHRRADSTTPLAEAVMANEARFYSSAAELLRRFPRMQSYVEQLGGVSGVAYLPLTAQARTIGGLALIFRQHVRFSAEDRDLCLGMAAILSQSLQRAMLFDSERDVATSLQESMLPRSIPKFDGTDIAVRYRAASSGRAVGGDWYDVIALPGGRVGVVVGDVQGHDTHAAAIMGQLRIALRAFAGEGHAPSRVLERASRFLTELDTDRFATCTYAEVYPATGEVGAARAGHLNPLVRNGDGTVSEPDLEGGLPLGIATEFGREYFPETRAALAPGESLILCTDGLVEEAGSDLTVGVADLAEAVRTGPPGAEALADHIAECLSDRWGTHDDVALLILRRLPARR